MPDFLLCNSKLTFQMTMIPDKTNYLTQGPDGVKRLKQGPDLGSYRGLSIVHSRAFAMETGQHPRDILRRRVRTAEYYRIPPSKDNLEYEFELYNEERDTWFTLSFKDLIKCALLGEDDPYASEYSADLQQVYEQAVQSHQGKHMSPHKKLQGTLGADRALLGAKPYVIPASLYNSQQIEDDIVTPVINAVDDIYENFRNNNLTQLIIFPHQKQFVYAEPAVSPFPVFNFGAKVIPLKQNMTFQLQLELSKQIELHSQHLNWMKFSGSILAPHSYSCVFDCPRVLTRGDFVQIFSKFQNQTLYDPFGDTDLQPGSAQWFQAYTFYLTCFQRAGVFMDLFQWPATGSLPSDFNLSNNYMLGDNMMIEIQNLPKKEQIPEKVDVSSQFLSMMPGFGNVNHPWCMNSTGMDPIPDRDISVDGTAPDIADFLGSTLLVTWELLGALMAPVSLNGNSMPFIEALHRHQTLFMNASVKTVIQETWQKIGDIFNPAAPATFPTSNAAVVTSKCTGLVLTMLSELRGRFQDFGLVVTDLSSSSPPLQVILAQNGIDTWPMGITTLSRAQHILNNSAEGEIYKQNKDLVYQSYGHLNLQYLEKYANMNDTTQRWRYMRSLSMSIADATERNVQAGREMKYSVKLIQKLYQRLFEIPKYYIEFMNAHLRLASSQNKRPSLVIFPDLAMLWQSVTEHDRALVNYMNREHGLLRRASVAAGPNLSSVTLFGESDTKDLHMPPEAEIAAKLRDRLEDVEIVIVRPNIEHHMLGIIMGLGGSELGNTLWGQTELSVYDDSMHGIWGMSYKYHARSIVFNEKNLIRLWDIAYDGYNGGKDDTYVNWTDGDEATPNGYNQFKRQSINTNSNYRGPSMMVMAFVHNRTSTSFEQHFRRNWPSPIVYHDSYNYEHPEQRDPVMQLPVDCENIEIINADEYRVFNNPLYASYAYYREKMPAFNELHKMRKSAGQSSVDSDTPQDSLAFQGSMRIKKKGCIVQEIHGSGHHGPDYIGVASVRAGKGQKVQAQAPALYRMV